jgi:WD40 repeat protein
MATSRREQILQLEFLNKNQLFGKWRRRKVVKELARDPSSDAAWVLAQAVVSCPDDKVQYIALAALGQRSDQDSIDQVCQVWEETRSERLVRIMIEGVWVAREPILLRILSAIQVGALEVVTEGGVEILDPLFEACKDKNEELSERARECLLHLENRDAIDNIYERWVETRDDSLQTIIQQGGYVVRNQETIDKLCRWWVETRDDSLQTIIQQGGYVARVPIAVRVFSTLLVGEIDGIKGSGNEVIQPLLDACDDHNPEISERAKTCLLYLTNSIAIDCLCQLVLRSNDRVACDIAIEAGYAPEVLKDRVLFYFLTGQWDEYEALDLDHALLQAIYETSDDQTRSRISDGLRQTGRSGWLRVVLGGGQRLRIGNMNKEEWTTIIDVLAQNKRWNEMWHLAQEAPAEWSQLLIVRLNKADWEPDDTTERPIWCDLNNLSERCNGISIPTIRSGSSVIRHIKNVEGSNYQFSPDGYVLATEFSSGIHLSQFPQGTHIKTVDGSNLKFSSNSKVLATQQYEMEHGKTDESGLSCKVRLYSLPEGTAIKTINGFNQELSPDGEFLATTTHDSQVYFGGTYLYGLSDGELLRIIGDSRQAEFSPDSSLLATGHSSGYYGNGYTHLHSLPDGTHINTMEGDYHTFSPDGKVLATLGSKYIINLYRLPMGEHIKTISSDNHAFSPDGQTLICWNEEELDVYLLPEGEVIKTIKINNMSHPSFSPDGLMLAISAYDGTNHIFHLPDGVPIMSTEGRQQRPSFPKFSPDGKILSIPEYDTDNPKIYLYHILGGDPFKTINGYEHEFSPDGQILVCWNENKTDLYRLPGGQFINSIKGRDPGFSPDGQWLATLRDDETCLYCFGFAHLSRLPIREIKQEDQDWMTILLAQNNLLEPEHHWMSFILALVRNHRRFDIEVGDAPRTIEAGEFDIEIET